MWASESNAKTPVAPALQCRGQGMLCRLQVAVSNTDYAQVSHARHGWDVHANAGVAMQDTGA